jgi:hypothetical protein
LKLLALLLLPAIHLLTACEAADADRTRSRVGDTLLVSNQRPIHPDTAELALVRRYGAFDASLEYELGSVVSFAVGPDGDVYVLDADVGIKHFDVSGAFSGWVARMGSGPDEVAFATLLAAGPGGEVAAYDLENGRLAIFSADSATAIMPRPSGMPRYGEDGLFFANDGSLWVGITPPAGPGPDPVTFPRPAFARVNQAKELVDTMFVPADVSAKCPTLVDGQYRAGFWEDKRVQWFPMATWAMGRDGSFAVGCPARYELDVQVPGAPPLRLERSWTPVRTDPDEESFYVDLWQPLPPLPRTRPAYTRIVLPGDGRIWVWPVQPSETRPLDDAAAMIAGRSTGWMSGRHGAFDVFDDSGAWIGSVALPEGVVYSGYPDTEPVVIRGDTIWVLMLGEIDVPYIGRFEVRWP